MEKKELKDLTLEELKQRSKTSKTIAWFLAGTLLVLLGVAIYYSARKGEIQIPPLVVVLAGLVFVFLSFGNIKKINSEIKSRKKQ
jgi:FtsH-binding integral membrane protein